MKKIEIGKYVEDALTLFGEEVNLRRQLPYLYDGLKPVYRRVTYTALGYGLKSTKTATLIGTTLGTLHPHGDKSIIDPIANMVRWGMFKGKGNHGAKLIYGRNIEPSAPRYTGARISDKFYAFFKDLMPYVPYDEAELEGNMEPRYLPTPFPLALLYSTQGIGFGANCRIPAFTMESLYEALRLKDYSKLEAPFNMTIDHKMSELESLWNVGIGKVTYKYKVEKTGIEMGYGTMITGDPELFSPKLELVFEEELAKGQVYIIDQTDKTGTKVFVGLSAYVRAISLDEIQERCEKACTWTKTFRLTVADNDRAYVIPLKDWIQVTYDNYLSLIDLYKEDKVKDLKFQYRVFDWLPAIVNFLLKDRNSTPEDLVKCVDNPDCDIEVVRAILKKSINTLRMTDSTAKLKGIKKQIKEYESIVPENYVEKIINEF